MVLLSESIKDAIYLLFKLLNSAAKLLRPGGGRAVIAENLLLFSPYGGRKPAPKGPSRDIIVAIVAMKRRNP